MAPIFEEPTGRLIGGTFQQAGIVLSKPGEQRHELGPGNDIDRVDLKLRQATRNRLQIAHCGRPLSLRRPKALCKQRDPPRLSLAQLLASHSDDASALQ
jgi:hypothetical protein